MIRCKDNPIITRQDIKSDNPVLTDVSSVFNPGAILFNQEIILLLRVQNRGRETFLVKARSKDGIEFEIENNPVEIMGLEKIDEPFYHIYDPRITKIDNRYYIIVAIDCDSGCKLGLIITDDFQRYGFAGIISGENVRNGVLFPEKINGKYMLLLRPNQESNAGVASGDRIVLCESDDMIHWNEKADVLSGRPHYWDELIGSGPPPLKTEQGWLHIYHGVATHFQSVNIYQAGAVLLDLDDPSKVIGRTRQNILEPREIYELVGQVPIVVFPSGMIVRNNSELLLYYGAADSSVCLATTTVNQIIEECMRES